MIQANPQFFIGWGFVNLGMAKIAVNEVKKALEFELSLIENGAKRMVAVVRLLNVTS